MCKDTIWPILAPPPYLTPAPPPRLTLAPPLSPYPTLGPFLRITNNTITLPPPLPPPLLPPPPPPPPHHIWHQRTHISHTLRTLTSHLTAMAIMSSHLLPRPPNHPLPPLNEEEEEELITITTHIKLLLLLTISRPIITLTIGTTTSTATPSLRGDTIQ